MKTTIELPDDLLVAAKKKAVEERRPLRALLEEALRKQLTGKFQEQAKKRKINWARITVEGPVPWEVDISSRESMHRWLRRTR